MVGCQVVVEVAKSRPQRVNAVYIFVIVRKRDNNKRRQFPEREKVKLLLCGERERVGSVSQKI